MTILVFNDGGYDVATQSWTVCSKSKGKSISICYTWGADGASFFDSATGVSRVDFNISMDEFLELIKGKAIVDWRSAKE